MDYQCSVCRAHVAGDMIVYKDHIEKHIVDLVKIDHPDWVEGQGMCQKCVDYYAKELRGGVFGDAACAMRRRKAKSFLQTIAGFFKGKEPSS